MALRTQSLLGRIAVWGRTWGPAWLAASLALGCGANPKPRAATGDVRGRVWNSGEPAAWAELEWSHELGRGGQGTADEAGAFELTGLPPGQVTLVAYPAGRERLALQGKRVLDPSVRFPGKTLAERIVYTDGFRSIGGLAPGEYWFMTHPDTFRVEPSSVVVPILDGRPVTLRCVYPDQGHPDHWGERR